MRGRRHQHNDTTWPGTLEIVYLIFGCLDYSLLCAGHGFHRTLPQGRGKRSRRRQKAQSDVYVVLPNKNTRASLGRGGRTLTPLRHFVKDLLLALLPNV